MTDQPLSQEMIDALLKQASGGAPAAPAQEASPQPDSLVSQNELDALEAVAASVAGAPASKVSPLPPELATTPPEDAHASASPATYAPPPSFGSLGGDTSQKNATSTGKPGGVLNAAETASVRPAIFSPLPVSAPPPNGSSIDLLLDVPLQVTVELGRTHLSVREVLGLGAGSVVELEKLAGEPVDLFVNNRLIARGEVVVIDENFGVRVTEIVRPGDAPPGRK